MKEWLKKLAQKWVTRLAGKVTALLVGVGIVLPLGWSEDLTVLLVLLAAAVLDWAIGKIPLNLSSTEE